MSACPKSVFNSVQTTVHCEINKIRNNAVCILCGSWAKTSCRPLDARGTPAHSAKLVHPANITLGPRTPMKQGQCEGITSTQPRVASIRRGKEQGQMEYNHFVWIIANK